MITDPLQTFVQKLHLHLQKGSLPGWEAQQLMQPSLPNRVVDMRTLCIEGARKAAVLLALYKKRGVLHTVLIKRAVYDGVHSGQMAFPGGRAEEEDRDYFDTAIREAEEEVGIPRASVQILGALSPIYIPPSNFLVYPVLAYLDAQPSFVLQESEVKGIVEIPIGLFCRSEAVSTLRLKLPNVEEEFIAPSFSLCGVDIWGATAMVIQEACALFRVMNYEL